MNVAGVLATIGRLREKGWKIPEDAVTRGLRDVRSLTGLMGRWQLVKERPNVIVDVGHNLDGIREILRQLEHENYSDLHWVIGVVEDKDLSGILPLLPAAATYYCCKPDLPRGRDAAALSQVLRENGHRAEAYPSVALALAAAIRSAKERDIILVAGSTFVVAESMVALRD
jgi:dihydrofolate synthase/folylpolyglutamate synthase